MSKKKKITEKKTVFILQFAIRLSYMFVCNANDNRNRIR